MITRAVALVRDLHRRRVFRAAALYLVSAWVVIEVSTTIFPLIGLPEWSERLVLALLALGLPVALALAWAFDFSPDGLARTPATPAVAEPAPPPRSIAVLPFLDLSRAHDQEYLADGIADEILTALARASDLRVAARTSAFAYRGRNLDVREIGRQLEVASVLEGSVRAEQDRLRVTAQLIDVGDGYQRWSRRFDRPLQDVFAVQEEIAAEIAEAIGVTAESVCTPSVPCTPEAYDYYLRGRRFFHMKTLRSWRFAEQMFRRALQADPGFALAHAGLADTCAFLFMYSDGSRELQECAESSSAKALEFGPELPEAHVSRGLAVSLSGRYDEAAAEFDRALELCPRSFEAHYFRARTCVAQGDLPGAARLFRLAADIQPDSYETWGLLGTVLLGLGRTDEFMDAQHRAAQAAERVLAASPDDVRALCFGAGALHALGQSERALEWAERAAATEPDDAGVNYNLACFYVQAGLRERALQHLERAIELGFSHRDWLDHDPDLAALRQEPRFLDAVARIPAIRR